jgi:uncharacterized membrane protein
LVLPVWISKLPFCSRSPGQNDGVGVFVAAMVFVAVGGIVLVGVAVQVLVGVIVDVAVAVRVGVAVLANAAALTVHTSNVLNRPRPADQAAR